MQFANQEPLRLSVMQKEADLNLAPAAKDDRKQGLYLAPFLLHWRC